MVIGPGVLDRLATLVDKWGYWIIFFGVMLENAGIPVPGETVLLAAGFFASRGRLLLAPVMALATAGAITGDNFGYWIGRRLGRQFLLKYGKYVFLTPERLAAMDRFFEAHGAKTVAVARFITGLRVFTALFAGASKMNWPSFLTFNLIGAVAWSTVITLLGYFFGQSFDLLERWISGAGFVLAGLIVAAILVKLVITRRRPDAGWVAWAETEGIEPGTVPNPTAKASSEE